MFEGNRLSSIPVPAPLIGAGSEAMQSRVFDHEDGPVDYQDPSQGQRYQQWRAYLKESAIYIEADNRAPEQLLASPGNTITDISIAFDWNGNLHYAWVDQGVARMYWYDTQAADYATMQLPAGVRTPKMTLDDKRPRQSGRADIILAYIKSDNGLYFRMQRDRFGIERLLDAGPFISLDKMYMNSGLRLQFELTRGDPGASP